jgi:hypothetical protein
MEAVDPDVVLLDLALRTVTGATCAAGSGAIRMSRSS